MFVSVEFQLIIEVRMLLFVLTCFANIKIEIRTIRRICE